MRGVAPNADFEVLIEDGGGRVFDASVTMVVMLIVLLMVLLMVLMMVLLMVLLQLLANLLVLLSLLVFNTQYMAGLSSPITLIFNSIA